MVIMGICMECCNWRTALAGELVVKILRIGRALATAHATLFNNAQQTYINR
jgi:hypothetical protein